MNFANEVLKTVYGKSKEQEKKRGCVKSVSGGEGFKSERGCQRRTMQTTWEEDEEITVSFWEAGVSGET